MKTSIQTISGLLSNTITELELNNDIDRRKLFTYSGFKNYDKLIGGGFKKGRLSVLSPRTNKGRSALTLSKAYDLAKEGTKVGYISTKKTPKELLYQIIANKSSEQLDSFNFDTKQEDCLGVLKNLKSQLEVPLLVCSKKTEPNEKILDDCKKMVIEGADIIMVDFFQIFEPCFYFDTVELEKRGLSTEDTYVLSIFEEFAYKHNVSLTLIL